MMSPSTIAGLSGMELYNELIRHGYPAGPVVASTRKLYERKLLEILEREDKEEVVVTQEKIQDDSWRQLTSSRVQEPQSNLGIRLSYSRNETIGQGGMHSQSNSQESGGLSSSRWTREISGSTVFKTPYSSMSEEDPLQRRNYPDTILGQTGLSSRYSLSTPEFASGLARRGIHQKTKTEVPLKTKIRTGTNLRMILYAVFVVATFVMLYFVLQYLV